MASQLWANYANSSLLTRISAGDTSLTFVGDDGALFPSPGAGEYFYLTISNFLNSIYGTPIFQYEIVSVSARSGNTCTVVRAQQGTTALNWPAGANVSLVWTANDFATLQAGGGGGGSYTGTFPIVVGGGAISLDPSATEFFQKASFTHATSSPLVLQAVAPPQFITRALIVLSTPFNDPTATLSVGTTATPGLVLQTTDTAVLYDEQYESDAIVPFPISDYLQLVISPGSSTQGAGTIYYWYRN